MEHGLMHRSSICALTELVHYGHDA